MDLKTPVTLRPTTPTPHNPTLQGNAGDHVPLTFTWSSSGTHTVASPVPRPTLAVIPEMRLAGEQDRARVLDFHSKLDKEAWSRRFNGMVQCDPNCELVTDLAMKARSILCLCGDELVGIAMVSLDEKDWEGFHVGIVVPSKYHGGGVGRNLMDAAEKLAVSNGMKFLFAQTDGASHLNASQLMKNRGYRNLPPTPDGQVHWTKDLQQQNADECCLS